MTLSDTQKTELKALFDASLNDKLAELRNEFISKFTKLAELETNYTALKATVQTFSANTGNTEVLRALKADIVEHSKQIDTIKSAMSTGNGMQRASNVQFDAGDIKAMLPSKIAKMSLGEVVEATQ